MYSHGTDRGKDFGTGWDCPPQDRKVSFSSLNIAVGTPTCISLDKGRENSMGKVLMWVKPQMFGCWGPSFLVRYIGLPEGGTKAEPQRSPALGQSLRNAMLVQTRPLIGHMWHIARWLRHRPRDELVAALCERRKDFRSLDLRAASVFDDRKTRTSGTSSILDWLASSKLRQFASVL